MCVLVVACVGAVDCARVCVRGGGYVCVVELGGVLSLIYI